MRDLRSWSRCLFWVVALCSDVAGYSVASIFTVLPHGVTTRLEGNCSVNCPYHEHRTSRMNGWPYWLRFLGYPQVTPVIWWIVP